MKNISIFLRTFPTVNIVCNEKDPWMLKVLHGNIKANKEPLLDYMEVGKHQRTTESSICVTPVYCGQFMKAAYGRYVVLQLRYPTILCVQFSGWCKEHKWHVMKQMKSVNKRINANYFTQNGRCFGVSCASG